MQSKSTAAADLSAYFESHDYGHADTVACLVLDRWPSEDNAYSTPEDDEPRFTITDAGRRALRLADLFGAFTCMPQSGADTTTESGESTCEHLAPTSHPDCSAPP